MQLEQHAEFPSFRISSSFHGKSMIQTGLAAWEKEVPNAGHEIYYPFWLFLKTNFTFVSGECYCNREQHKK